jgi:predicted CXXCH cytochrome family protein
VDWSLGSDSESGVDHYDLYVNGAPYASYTSTGTVLTGLTPNAIYSLYVVTVDIAGNVSAASPTALATTTALAALTTSIAVVPSAPDGANSWYITMPTVSLTASPTVPTDTYYSWNGSALTTYTGPIVPPTGGTHTLDYWSVDQAGQRAQEATNQATIKVDTTPPSAPSTISASLVSTSSLALTWEAGLDPESGISSYDLFVNGALQGNYVTTGTALSGLSPNAHYEFYVVAINGAGRTAASAEGSAHTEANSEVYTVDTVTPLAPNGTNGWYVTTPTVTLESMPTTLPAYTYYWWDEDAPTLYAGALQPALPGTQTLSYYSVDQVDSENREATETITFKVDTEIPGAPTSVNAWTLSTSSISVDWSRGSDSVSGVDHYDLYVNGAPYASYTSTGTVLTGLTPNAIYSLYVVTVDVAGNVSAASPTALATTTALSALTTSIAVVPSAPDGANSWYVTTPTVSFSVSPVVPTDTYYSWNGSALTTYTGSIQPATSGVLSLDYWSADQARQREQETTQQATLKVDLLPDVRSGSVPATGYASLDASAPIITDSTAQLSWVSAGEPFSGVDRYEVWNGAFVGSTAGNLYVVAGLSPSTEYRYRVYGVNYAGTYFSVSETITVNTSSTPIPVPPTVVAAQAPNGNTVNVAWQEVTSYVGAIGYRVWRSEDGVDYSQVATLTGSASNHYLDVELGSSKRYWYAVSVFDDRGESALSDTSTAVWDVIAPTTGLPDRPNGLTAVEASSTIALTWEPSNNPSVVGYRVLRANSSLGTTTVLADVAAPLTGYFDFSPLNDYFYYYSVVAVDASGTVGRPSLEVMARPHRLDGTLPHVTGADAGCACHRSHTGTGEKELALPGVKDSTLCLACHSGVTAGWNTKAQINDPFLKSTHPIATTTAQEGELTCDSCHRPVYADGEDPQFLLRVNGSWVCTSVADTPEPSGNGFCYGCHGEDSTLPFGDLSVFEQSDHATIADPPSGSGIQCEYCHATHASRNERLLKYSNFMLCMQCHNSSAGLRNPDIWTRIQASDQTQTTHPMLPEAQTGGAQLVCENCHNTHDATHENPLVDPYNPGPEGRWVGARGDEAAYCFTCHDGGALPTAAETGKWADPVYASGGATTVPDIEEAYNVNRHGFGLATDPVAAQAYLRPDMGYTTNSVLECRSCHDPHGTTNAYTLNSTVSSADGSRKIEGLLVYKIPAGSLSPTSPVGYDLRFYCNACHIFNPTTHDPKAGTDTTAFPNDCHSCHQHMNEDRTAGSTGL